jgi:hypothetical protein
MARPESNQQFGGAYSNAYSGRSTGGSTFDRKGSLGPLSPSTIMTTVETTEPIDFTTMITKGKMVGDFPGDFERMGVRVDKSYSLRHGNLGGVGHD